MLVHLHSLSSLLVPGARPLRFPRQLASVDLHVEFRACIEDEKDEENTETDEEPQLRCQSAFLVVLRGLSAACDSLTQVKLTVATWTQAIWMESAEWDVTPLLQLKHLRRLTLKGWPHLHYGAKQIAVIKQIATLQSLELLLPYENNEFRGNGNVFALPWLAALCEPPHRLQQLEELDLSKAYLSRGQMLQLQQLPALTTLEPTFLSILALPTLASFPHLLRLSLALDSIFDARHGGLADHDVPEDMFDARGFPRASLFLPHLRCTQLHKLALRLCVFNEEEALALCQLLPQLTHLTLTNVGWPSLEPLRHLTQLTALSMRLACHTSLNFKLAHLQELKSLQKLTLLGLHPPLDGATVAALQPPYALMPALTSLNFYPHY